MLSRTCALSLVVLILLPFSAPFSTCDVATMFPDAKRHATQPAGAESPMTSFDDAGSAHALPLPRVTGRTRFVAADLRPWMPTAILPHTSTYLGPVALGFVASPFRSPLRI